MASAYMKQAFGAYVRKQGQRLWQLNYYRMKLNAYNRVAFRDAHKESTMQFTHLGLEFMPFPTHYGVLAPFQNLRTAREKGETEKEHTGLTALVLHRIVLSIFHPNMTMFSDSL